MRGPFDPGPLQEATPYAFARVHVCRVSQRVHTAAPYASVFVDRVLDRVDRDWYGQLMRRRVFSTVEAAVPAGPLWTLPCGCNTG